MMIRFRYGHDELYHQELAMSMKPLIRRTSACSRSSVPRVGTQLLPAL
jgi:hypothetical protein